MLFLCYWSQFFLKKEKQWTLLQREKTNGKVKWEQNGTQSHRKEVNGTKI